MGGTPSNTCKDESVRQTMHTRFMAEVDGLALAVAAKADGIPSLSAVYTSIRVILQRAASGDFHGDVVTRLKGSHALPPVIQNQAVSPDLDWPELTAGPLNGSPP